MEKTTKNGLLKKKEISTPVLGIEHFPRLFYGKEELLEELQKMSNEIELNEVLNCWDSLSKSDWYFIVGWVKSAINQMYKTLSLGSALYLLTGYERKVVFETISYWYENADWEEKANYERGFYTPKNYKKHGSRVSFRK